MSTPKSSDKTDFIQTDLLVFVAAALTSDTRRLVHLIDRSSDRETINTLFRSLILVAASALEAILSEYAVEVSPQVYSRKMFRTAGVPQKYHQLDLVCPEDVNDLWKHRIALMHSEPHNKRSADLTGLIIVSASAQIADIVEREAMTIWKKNMPHWFSEITGLYPLPNGNFTKSQAHILK